MSLFTDTGLNYELQFNSNKLGFVLHPGPSIPMNQITVCLWLKTSTASTFVYYHVDGETGPAFQFGINPSKKLFGHINGSLVKRYII